MALGSFPEKLVSLSPPSFGPSSLSRRLSRAPALSMRFAPSFFLSFLRGYKMVVTRPLFLSRTPSVFRGIVFLTSQPPFFSPE